MTAQSSVNDLASLLMQPDPEPNEVESTGGTDEQEVSAQTEEADDYELEAEADGEIEDPEEDDLEDAQAYIVKVDGEEVEVTLKEALQGYQRDSDYRKKTMKVSEDRKAVEARSADIDAKLQELDSFIKGEEESIDWEELRRTDADEFLKKRDALDEAKSAAETARTTQQNDMQAKREAFGKQEAAKFSEMMGGDSWTQEQRTEDLGVTTEYLKGIGMTDNDISSIQDHRLWRMAMDAAKAKQFNDSHTKVKKEIRKAPKSVKPGQRVPTSQRKKTKALNKLQSSTKYNSTDNLAEYLMLSD
jgi:hypothetical protein